jgi:hypothetical protein
MERKELEVYSEAPNYAIVRMPGRRFPGCVIQGDSLSILYGLARSINDRVAGLEDGELADDAADLLNQLKTRLQHYEQVLAEHRIELPYVRPQ